MITNRAPAPTHPRSTGGLTGYALGVLRRIWPEACGEFHEIVRTLVFVQGGGFIYGSFQNMLGSIFIGVNSVSSLASTVEMLLHEGGHQSLFLHSAFGKLVTNPTEPASHPLRADPRPVGGTVHAAHVLARMAIGFSRWCDAGGAPTEIHRRRDEVVGNLRTTIAVLDEKAEWTEQGHRYYSRLLDSTASLVHRSPAAVG